MKLTQKQIQHLYWRAGLFENHLEMPKKGELRENIWNSLKSSSQKFSRLEVLDQNEFDFKAFKNMSKEEKNMLMKESRNQSKLLNKKWFDHLTTTSGVLRERMSLFWHNHFACTSKNVFFLQSYLNTIRENSLGSFRDLLHAVSREPAMLQYLNNQQNRKNKPNENFAREVMELFTVGRGNYTEQDVKNAARSFTGWSFTPEGEFLLQKRQHDEDEKEIFGKKGNLGGEEVLDLLLEKKETALFVTKKLYQYFVNDVTHEERVKELANIFYENNYDIMPLLEAIFLSDWFYEEENIGNKIKSPIDLTVGICRSMHVSFSGAEGPLYIQKHLGQMLLNPPNVAGWPGGKQWIDSSTLLFRSRLVELILISGEINLGLKNSGDDNDQFQLKKVRKLGTNYEMKTLNKYFTQLKEEKDVIAFLVQTNLQLSEKGYTRNIDNLLVRNIIEICRTPEYQMC